MKKRLVIIVLNLFLIVSVLTVSICFSSTNGSYNNLSLPIYDVTVEKNVFIPMRDGVNLAADLYLPNSSGKFPAIVVYLPYGKDVAANYGGTYGNDLWYFAERGYVGIFCDLRGTGSSEGVMNEYFEYQEWIDGYDLVEWVASQPWCDGNVGMHGTSYGAITSTRVAAMQPPHLKAISVQSSFANMYGEHFFAGGARVTAPFVWISGPPNITGTMIRPPLYDDPRYPDRLLTLWKQHLMEGGWGTMSKKQWDHPLYDEFWMEKDLRSKIDEIKVPVLQIGCQFDRTRDMDETYLNFIAFKRNKIPQKLIMGPWNHGRGVGNPYEFGMITVELAWFDYWLKGIDTGIMDEPPVTIFIQRDNKYRFEKDWPIHRTKYKKFYLSPKENLYSVKGRVNHDIAKEGRDSLSYTYRPEVGVAAGPYGYDFMFQYEKDGFRKQMDQSRDEIYSLTFTSEELTNDMEVTGMPEIVLHASSTANDTNFCVKLCDVLPDGKSEMVARGWLNSSYRESNVNPRYPEDWRFVEPTKITPGEVYKYQFTLHNTSYVFKKGHRIRIAISSSDWPFIWPNPNLAVNQIYFSGGQSYVILPVVLAQCPALPEPVLPPKVSPVVIPGKIYPKTISRQFNCWIEEDLVNDVTTYNYENTGYWWETATSKIWEEVAWQIKLPKNKPSDQFVSFTSTWRWEREGKSTLQYIVNAPCDAFNGPQMEVETTIDGVPFFP